MVIKICLLMLNKKWPIPLTQFKKWPIPLCKCKGGRAMFNRRQVLYSCWLWAITEAEWGRLILFYNLITVQNITFRQRRGRERFVMAITVHITAAMHSREKKVFLWVAKLLDNRPLPYLPHIIANFHPWSDPSRLKHGRPLRHISYMDLFFALQ